MKLWMESTAPVAEASKTEEKSMNGCMCVKTLDPNPEP